MPDQEVDENFLKAMDKTQDNISELAANLASSEVENVGLLKALVFQQSKLSAMQTTLTKELLNQVVELITVTQVLGQQITATSIQSYLSVLTIKDKGIDTPEGLNERYKKIIKEQQELAQKQDDQAANN